MSYPRVNLIHKNEQRYQGAVSRSFILLTGIGTPVLLIVLILGFVLIQNMSVKSQLASSTAVWETYEPRLKQYRAEKSGLTTSGKIMGLFEGWEKSQASIVDLMEEVQDRVPQDVQFTRMSIRSNTKGAVFKTAEELVLDYSLTIDGVAVGQQAEGLVLALQRDLQASQSVSSTFDSLKLASMRNRNSNDGSAMSEFRLVGEAGKGGE